MEIPFLFDIIHIIDVVLLIFIDIPLGLILPLSFSSLAIIPPFRDSVLVLEV
jgi:hypothetical protein